VDNFDGKLAVITGAGDGMGRSLAVQLAGEGAHLALCDVFSETLAETKRLCLQAALDNRSESKVSVHHCDVGIEADLIRFRDEALAEHETSSINLLFNNAGIGGGGSLVTDSRQVWERTFDVCWGGVYWGTRAFLDALIAADEALIVNTSSVNGFWASLGPSRPHTAYSAAKFAVKGFTEALISDLALNAPHVKVAVVMPGHIGTGIAGNSALVHAADGVHIDPGAAEQGAAFRNSAPTTAGEAATAILDSLRAGQWRILIGEDAHVIDMEVRQDPESAYEPGFLQRLGSHLQSLITDK